MSTKCYQKTKKSFQKKLAKGIKIFLKKRRTKAENMVLNDTKRLVEKRKKNCEKIKPLHS